MRARVRECVHVCARERACACVRVRVRARAHGSHEREANLCSAYVNWICECSAGTYSRAPARARVGHARFGRVHPAREARTSVSPSLDQNVFACEFAASPNG